VVFNIGTKCNSLTQQFIRISTTIDTWATCFDSIESSSGPQRLQIQLLLTLRDGKHKIQCCIQLNHDCDKLCILAVCRSPSGNIDNFPTNLDLVLQKLFLLKFTFIICGDININYLADSYKNKQLDSILYSF